jgi:hypothetical protein
MSTARERSGIGSSNDLVTINVNGVPVLIDQRTLTMRERQQVKSELHKLDYPADQMDMLMGAIWVVMRRTDPTLTFAEVCESITVGDLEDVEAVGSDDSPEV